MKKKKILILANDFPPYVSIGAMRPYGWAKFLPKNEWEVTVITRHWDVEIKSAIDCVKSSLKQDVEITQYEDFRLIQVPYKANFRDNLLIKYGYDKYKILRKFLSFIIEFTKHNFFVFDVLSPIYFEAKQLLKSEKFDLIVATAEPFILFKYAHILSGKYAVKWVADYRDTWTYNQEQKKLSQLELFLLSLNKRKEKKYLTNASLITTASPSYKVGINHEAHQKIEVILNGYIHQSDELVLIPDLNKFKIAYVGTIYSHQNIELFAAGVKKFIQKQNLSPEQVVITFYGVDFIDNQKNRVFAAFKGYENYIELTQKLAYNELLSNLMNSSVLLLMSKEGMNWLNAKVYDYLLLNKPILFVGNDKGILEQILSTCQAEFYSSDSIEFIVRNLEFLFEKYRKFGMLQSTNNLDKVSFYSRENQTLILSEKLKELLLNC